MYPKHPLLNARSHIGHIEFGYSSSASTNVLLPALYRPPSTHPVYRHQDVLGYNILHTLYHAIPGYTIIYQALP